MWNKSARVAELLRCKVKPQTHSNAESVAINNPNVLRRGWLPRKWGMVAKENGSGIAAGFELNPDYMGGYNSAVSIIPDPPIYKNRKMYLTGNADHWNGLICKHSENADYMAGWNSYEPLVVTRRCAGKKPKYSLDVDYKTETTGLPDWYDSVKDAVFYARAAERPNKLWSRIYDYHHKNELLFESLVAVDSLIKTDVKRLYQSTIDDGLSTSIDGGQTWFDGGIMNYHKMPKVDIREVSYRLFQKIGSSTLQPESRYSTRTKPFVDNLKKGSFKLKPPRPSPPKFDAVAWRNDHEDWWRWHLEQSHQASLKKASLMYQGAKNSSHLHIDEIAELDALSQCVYDYDSSKSTEHKNPQWNEGNQGFVEKTYYLKEWRCPCYHAKVAEYEKAVTNYQKAIEKWSEL